MGQPKQHHINVMHHLMGGGHYQVKKFCLWGLSMLVPFLLLFCIFPSGSSVFTHPLEHRIVVSQLQVPPLRTQAQHNTLPADAIAHRTADEEEASSSDDDEPDRESTEAGKHTDEPAFESRKHKKHGHGPKSKKAKKQKGGITAEQTSADPSASSKRARKQRKKGGYDDPNIFKPLMDNEPDEQNKAENDQPDKDEGSDTAIEEEVSLSGKGIEKQDDEASAAAKSTSGRKPDTEEEKAGSDGASDLPFLEKEVFRLRTPKSDKNSVESVEKGGGEEDLGGEDGGVRDEDTPTQAKASTSQLGKCRYHEGRWIIDSTEPLYKDSTCSLMSIDDQNLCKMESNKTKHMRWRWQPSHCKTEQFKPKTFLKIMQGKSLAFVGDKLAKAQMESLLCVLSQVEKPNLVYEDATNKSSSWHFDESNFTMSMIWSSYLVQEVDENGHKKLHLDKLDTPWALMVPTLDVLVLGVGSLFIKPSIYMTHNEAVGCYACKDLGSQNMKEISLYSGFRASMKSAMMGVGSLPGFIGVTLFLQPYGFEGNGSYHLVSKKMKEIQEEELYEAYKRGSISNQSKMEVLHTNFLTLKKDDNVQGPTTSRCLVSSPLANTWNELLQHTLTRLQKS